MLNHLLPPTIPGTVPLIWHGGGHPLTHRHSGTIVYRSELALEGNRVCHRDTLFTIVADDIEDDLCAPVSGYVRWALTPAVTRPKPGRVLLLVEPDKSRGGPLSASQTVSSTRPTPPPPLSEATSKMELVLPPLSGEMVNLKWLHDTGLREERDRQNQRYQTSNGELLLAMMMVWSAAAEDVRKQAVKKAKEGK